MKTTRYSLHSHSHSLRNRRGYRWLLYCVIVAVPGTFVGNGGMIAQDGSAESSVPMVPPVAEATLATLPSGEGSPEAAELIARMVEIPYAGGAAGRGTTLTETLAYARSRSDTARMVRAYWRTSESICRLRTLAEHAERLRRLQPQSGDQPILEYLRSDVERQLNLVATTLRQDQEDLAEGMRLLQGTRGRRGTGESDTAEVDVRMPLPSDLPLTGGYETLFDQFYRRARGTLDPRARLLDATLPLRRTVVESRGSQVAGAEFVLQDTIDAYTNGRCTVQTLLKSVNESLRSREEFIAAVYQYNHDIADYTFMVSPELVGTSIVPRLVQPQLPEEENEFGLNLRPKTTVRISPQIPNETSGTNETNVATDTSSGKDSATDTERNREPNTGKGTETRENMALSHTVARPETKPASTESPTNSSNSSKTPSTTPPVAPSAGASHTSGEPAPINESVTPSKREPIEYNDGTERVPRLNLPGSKPYRPEKTKETKEPTSSEFLTASWNPNFLTVLTAMQEELPDPDPLPPIPDPTSPELPLPIPTDPTSPPTETPPTDPPAPTTPETPPLPETPTTPELPTTSEWPTPPAPTTPSETPPIPGSTGSPESPEAPESSPPSRPSIPTESSTLSPDLPPATGMTGNDSKPLQSPLSGTVPGNTGLENSATTSGTPATSGTTTPGLTELPVSEGRLYGTLDNVTLGIRARELAVSLHSTTVVPVPPSVTGTGAAMTLRQALERTSDPRAAIHAYWQTAFRTACYRVRLQEQAWMDGLSQQMSQYLASGGDPTTSGGDPGSLLRLNLAKQIVAAELAESQIRLWESQFRLTMVLGLPENAAWPAAVTVPHCGPFETYADRQPESIVGTPLGQRLVEIIPGRYEYLTTLATAVVMADAVRSGAMSAAAQDPGSLDAAIEAIRQQSAASEVFLEALFGYNRAIADYVSLIYTSPVSAEQWVQTLVVTVDGTNEPNASDGQVGTETATGTNGP